VKLYHGSNISFTQPDLVRCRPNKDFGLGFYLSPEYDGALHMAHRTVKRYGGEPMIMTYEFDESQVGGMSIRRFDGPSKEWALFVMANRRAEKPAEDHNRENRYGLVIGPIANDDLALLFRQFERGLATVEMLVREMQFKRLTFQYSFHTPEALKALAFREVEHVL